MTPPANGSNTPPAGDWRLVICIVYRSYVEASRQPSNELQYRVIFCDYAANGATQGPTLKAVFCASFAFPITGESCLAVAEIPSSASWPGRRPSEVVAPMVHHPCPLLSGLWKMSSVFCFISCLG